MIKILLYTIIYLFLWHFDFVATDSGLGSRVVGGGADGTMEKVMLSCYS